MEIPRKLLIRESSHRIHNPLTSEKLATLGRVLHLQPGMRMLDLACGSGEMLCTWARDHGITGTGVDISATFIANADARAKELGVSAAVTFLNDDAAGYVADGAVEIGTCIGATWIGGGYKGTAELLRRSLAAGGMMLIGEPYWRGNPPDQATLEEGFHLTSADEIPTLPELVDHFGELGCDVVEMVLADQDGWDRYHGAHWLNIRRWLDANPDDELAVEMRETLATAAARHVRYEREYLGWGVFALMDR